MKVLFSMTVLVAFLFLTGTRLSAQSREANTSYLQDLPAFSVIGRDSLTGDLGIAVEGEALAVGALVPYGKADVGAVVLHGSVDASYGRQAMEMLEVGKGADQVVDALLRNDSNANIRQIGVVDAHGSGYAYTGSQCRQWAGHLAGNGWSVQGNHLASETAVRSAARMFAITPGDLAVRLLAALDAGNAAEGNTHHWKSAALLVLREHGGFGGANDRMVDIRVDMDSLPLGKLHSLYDMWRTTYLADAHLRSVDEFNKNKKFAAADEEMKRLVADLNDEIRSKPDDPAVLDAVARTLATRHIDGQRALELAKRAVLLDPGKQGHLDTMAECHFVLGHFDEAIAIETSLVAKDPANDLYWRQLQKFKQAKENAQH